MRAVVTGGAGFIGSHLIEALIDRGADVVCVERPGAPRRWVENLDLQWRDHGLEDRRALRRAVRGADVIFHLAGLTEARSPRDFYRVNTEGTARVLDAASSSGGGAPRLLLLSSLAAIGPCRNGDLLSASTVPHPLSHYGNSKLLAEAVVHGYRGRVPATILRLSSVYGPRERAVLTLFQLIRRGVALTVGGWDREISLLYVDDLVQALIAAAASTAAADRTFCIAHPRPVTWREFAAAAGRALGREPRLFSLPVWAAKSVAVAAEATARARGAAAVLNRGRVREMAQHRWVCDARPAIEELGFRPAWPVERGVAETATWYRSVGWL
jgi:nucleoside-diphosphate-sugar epimerase